MSQAWLGAGWASWRDAHEKCLYRIEYGDYPLCFQEHISRQLVYLNQQLRQAAASSVQHGVTLVGGSGCGVAYCAVGVVVLHLPGQFGAAAASP